jgi:preprotein translocase subunit SecG
MEKIFFIVHIVVCISLVGLILIQQGKGAETGASFGSGASQTVFGSQGSANFITRSTAVMAAVFFITCLTLGYFAFQRQKESRIDNLMPQIEQQSAVKKAAEKPVVDSDIPELPTP